MEDLTLYMFSLCIYICSYVLNLIRKRPQKKLNTRPDALWDCERSKDDDGTQTGPLHARPQTLKKGGIHISSCLMCTCWRVFFVRACVCVLIFAHISATHGLCAVSILAGNTCFQLTGLESGATEQLHKGNKKETGVLLSPCQWGSAGG